MFIFLADRLDPAVADPLLDDDDPAVPSIAASPWQVNTDLVVSSLDVATPISANGISAVGYDGGIFSFLAEGFDPAVADPLLDDDDPAVPSFAASPWQVNADLVVSSLDVATPISATGISAVGYDGGIFSFLADRLDPAVADPLLDDDDPGITSLAAGPDNAKAHSQKVAVAVAPHNHQKLILAKHTNDTCHVSAHAVRTWLLHVWHEWE